MTSCSSLRRGLPHRPAGHPRKAQKPFSASSRGLRVPSSGEPVRCDVLPQAGACFSQLCQLQHLGGPSASSCPGDIGAELSAATQVRTPVGATPVPGRTPGPWHSCCQACQLLPGVFSGLDHHLRLKPQGRRLQGCRPQELSTLLPFCAPPLRRTAASRGPPASLATSSPPGTRPWRRAAPPGLARSASRAWLPAAQVGRAGPGSCRRAGAATAAVAAMPMPTCQWAGNQISQHALLRMYGFQADGAAERMQQPCSSLSTV
jgi:hypothetical protein